MFTLDTLTPLPAGDYPETVEPVDFDLTDDDRALCPFGCSANVDRGEPCRCPRGETPAERSARLEREFPGFAARVATIRRKRTPEEERRFRLDWGLRDDE